MRVQNCGRSEGDDGFVCEGSGWFDCLDEGKKIVPMM